MTALVLVSARDPWPLAAPLVIRCLKCEGTEHLEISHGTGITHVFCAVCHQSSFFQHAAEEGSAR